MRNFSFPAFSVQMVKICKKLTVKLNTYTNKCNVLEQ